MQMMAGCFRSLNLPYNSHFPGLAISFGSRYFRLIGEGVMNAEMAEQLHLILRTVANYRNRFRRLLRKETLIAEPFINCSQLHLV